MGRARKRMIDSLDVIPVDVPDTFPVVVFGASAGGIEALATILSALPDQFLAAIAIVQHRSRRPGSLAAVLTSLAKRSVRDAVEGDLLSPGCVFVAPAGSHLLINPDGTLSLSKLSPGSWPEAWHELGASRQHHRVITHRACDHRGCR